MRVADKGAAGGADAIVREAVARGMYVGADERASTDGGARSGPTYAATETAAGGKVQSESSIISDERVHVASGS